jgi:hypothetical protein
MNGVAGLKGTLTAVTMAVAALGSVGAKADLANGIVDQWTVGVNGQFLCGTAVATGPGPFTCAPTEMNWGTNGTSGLDLTNPAGPSIVNTNGPAVANLAVTHRNQPINAPSLDSVSLQSSLTLTPFAPPAPGLPTQTLTFLIDFQETPNGANPCADGGANGVGVNINGCGDIFVIDQSALNFAFQYDLGQGQGPQTYFISFFEETGGLNPLSPEACAAVGVASGCLGFVTPEQADTTFRFAARITTEPVSVPLPGTLAFLGTGLLLFGFQRRRA